jgi:hypothetical protein
MAAAAAAGDAAAPPPPPPTELRVAFAAICLGDMKTTAALFNEWTQEPVEALVSAALAPSSLSTALATSSGEGARRKFNGRLRRFSSKYPDLTASALSPQKTVARVVFCALVRQIEQLQTERDALKAQLDHVRAVCDENAAPLTPLTEPSDSPRS